jgi:hypothetical protein
MLLSVSQLLRVLICLACGPLLLPGGFCVCAEETALVQSGEDHDHDHDDHSHHADCPTSWEAVVSPATAHPDAGLLVEWLPISTGVDALNGLVNRLSLSASLPHIDPPLYLSNCALVI